MKMIKSIVHKTKNFRDAEAWDIKQHIQMSPEERQKTAKIPRERVYGKDCPDVRDMIRK